MRHVSMVGFACLFLASCGLESPAPTATPAPISIEETTAAEINGLKREVASMRRSLEVIEAYIGEDPKFLLYLMDHDLTEVEQGREALGSFSDYFVPNAARALEAGASMRDVDTRINRVVALAEQGKYLSGLVKQLMSDGGPEAIRSYAHGWIGQ